MTFLLGLGTPKPMNVQRPGLMLGVDMRIGASVSVQGRK